MIVPQIQAEKGMSPMIMKHWMHCPIVVTHGRLREWQIFKKRQGDHPNAETGEVCFDINCYGRAVLMPGVTTEPAAHDEEFAAKRQSERAPQSPCRRGWSTA